MGDELPPGPTSGELGSGIPAMVGEDIVDHVPHGNGRIILRTGPYPWQAVSLFVDIQQWPAAERVVGQIRTRTARARRDTA